MSASHRTNAFRIRKSVQKGNQDEFPGEQGRGEMIVYAKIDDPFQPREKGGEIEK